MGFFSQISRKSKQDAPIILPPAVAINPEHTTSQEELTGTFALAWTPFQGRGRRGSPGRWSAAELQRRRTPEQEPAAFSTFQLFLWNCRRFACERMRFGRTAKNTSMMMLKNSRGRNIVTPTHKTYV